MTADQELMAWRAQWKEPNAAVELPDLAARVKRQSRNLRLMLACEVLVTVVIGGGSLVMAVREGSAEMAVLAAATWAFIAGAWGFGLWNRRGTWAPAALTTIAFLEISIKRCRGAIRATAFGMWLYVVEMAFCLGWIWHHHGSWRILWSTMMLGLWVATAVFFVWAARYRRRQRAELEWLEGARDSFLIPTNRMSP